MCRKAAVNEAKPRDNESEVLPSMKQRSTDDKPDGLPSKLRSTDNKPDGQPSMKPGSTDSKPEAQPSMKLESTYNIPDRLPSMMSILSHGAAASFTIEAAVVVPVSFIAIAGMISVGLWMHDIVIGNMTANEAAELYNYMSEDEADTDMLRSYGETRLGAVLSEMDYEFDIEGSDDGSRVYIGSDNSRREYELKSSEPEKLMRQLTLIEMFAEKQE